MFNTETEENEDAEKSEEGGNKSGREINGYGIIPFVLRFCEVTNETFTEAMNYDVNTLFYIVSYEILKQKEQEKQIKRMQHK